MEERLEEFIRKLKNRHYNSKTIETHQRVFQNSRKFNFLSLSWGCKHKEFYLFLSCRKDNVDFYKQSFEIVRYTSDGILYAILLLP
jgi:hypothetical protein